MILFVDMTVRFPSIEDEKGYSSSHPVETISQSHHPIHIDSHTFFENGCFAGFLVTIATAVSLPGVTHRGHAPRKLTGCHPEVDAAPVPCAWASYY